MVQYNATAAAMTDSFLLTMHDVCLHYTYYIAMLQLIGTILSLCGKHRVKLESNFVSVIIAIAVLEGVGRGLDPDVNILRAALPVLVKAKAQGHF
jgi:predicted unusual protein kinase regulating ubiquinone biosynthesis (AarF/ABC1/UbiB family)